MYQKHIETTKKSNALNNLQSIRMAQEEYKADNNVYHKTDNSSSCSSDKNSTINTDLFEGTKYYDMDVLKGFFISMRYSYYIKFRASSEELFNWEEAFLEETYG